MRSRGRVRGLLQGVAVVLVLGFWVQALVRHWDQLVAYPWRVAWPALLAALGLLLLQAVLLATSWWYTLRLMGAEVAWRQGTGLWLRTQIARYLPGGVWDIAGRIVLGSQEGISVRALSASVVLEMALQVLSAAAFLLAVPLLRGGAVDRSYLPVTAVLMVACLVMATPPVFSRLVNLGLRVLRRPPLDIRMTYGDLLVLLGSRFVSHLLFGAGFVLFAWGVTPVTWEQVPAMMAAYVGAWLVGYLAVIIPMGIGVREAVLALLLQGLFPFGVVSAMALGYRGWLLIRDLLAALLGVWMSRPVVPEAHAAPVPPPNTPA